MNTTNNEKQMDKMFDRLIEKPLSENILNQCQNPDCIICEKYIPVYHVKQSIQEFLKEVLSDIEGGYESTELMQRIDTLAKKKFGDKILEVEK